MQTRLDTISNHTIMERKKYRWEQVADHYGIEMHELPDLIMRLLNTHETVTNLVDHFANEGIEISRETIDRFALAHKIEHFQCWRRVIDLKASVHARPITDDEGQAQ